MPVRRVQGLGSPSLSADSADAAGLSRPDTSGWTPERFQLAAQATRDVVWDWDLQTGRVAWAGDTQTLFGLSPEEIHLLPVSDYETWAGRIHPDDLPVTEAAARAALAGGAQTWEHEYRFRRPDGSWSTMLERAIIVRDSGGEPLRVVGAMQDISRRREGEAITARLAAIVVSSSDAIIGKTLDGVITSWNAAAERIFGYTEAEIVGRSILTLIPEELHDTEEKLLSRIRQGERVEFAEAERIRKDGSRVYVALSVSPIRDVTGTVIGASSIKRDVTERRRAQEQLAQREERYRALVTATSSIVSTTDAAGNFVEPQPSWEEYTGQSREEYRDLGWVNAIHADDRDAFWAAMTRARDQRSFYELEGRIWCRAFNGYRHFAARGAPVVSRDGTVREWIGTLTDVEDRWQAEQRLQHAERMESIGRLAGGVAHETNNQMTVVLGATRLLLTRAMTADVREDLELVRRAAERTAAITRQLLAFSRRQMLQPQIVSLNAVVDTMQPIIRRALGETSRLVLHLDPDLHPVTADPGQLDQVLLNLTLNARDAMPSGGVLTIETTNVVLDEALAAARPAEAIAPGLYARLTVSDTGMGMDRETLSHLFEPFFTTKDVGQGTGLGLPTVYGIVKQSGGLVLVSSEPGSGTSFEIYLPVVAEERGATPAAAAVPAGGGDERVMVVEDDPAVRTMIARTLRTFGYTVAEAESGAVALEMAGLPPGPPDLVVTDVVMPEMSGGELAVRLRERWPTIRILFTSGYAGVEPVEPGRIDQKRDFLQKPLDPETLAERVRRMLDAR